jgi:hypothetical protein
MTSALNRIRIAVATGVALCCLLGPATAAEANDATSVLFALDAQEGSLVPVKGKGGTFTLTLRNVDSRALAFDDRPGRQVGTIRVQKMIDQLFVPGQAPPNAAVNADVRGGGQALMGVQLGSPRYSARGRTLRFRVRQLVQRPGAARDSRVDTVLPRRFGSTALFIDDYGQPGGSQPTIFNTGLLALTVSVNNGSQFSIAGTGAFIGWTPQQPTSGGPRWIPAGERAPNALSPGLNWVTVTPEGSVRPFTMTINIPSNVDFASLQLYLFVNPSGDAAWTLMNNGEYVTSGVSSATP